MNPINFAIMRGKPQALQYLLNRYGNILRQALKGTDAHRQYEVKFGNEKLVFDSIGFAYLAYGKCTKVLNILLSNESFVPSKNDFASFVSACIQQ